jgi:hypothetical protein
MHTVGPDNLGFGLNPVDKVEPLGKRKEQFKNII